MTDSRVDDANESGLPDARPGAIVRRAPFSDNPVVGARGLRTQQRILDAALQVFGDFGYHRSSIDRITTLAGCSRVSFYQYFSGKEDVFRHLAGQIARQLQASVEALEPLTPDAAGWAAIRGWVSRYADVYERYEAVFRAFPQAAESDAALASGSVVVGQHNIARFQSKLTTTTLPPRQLDPVVALLLSAVARTLDIASILRSSLPADYPRARLDDAVADVIHRTLFGVRVDVNARPPTLGTPPTLALSSALRDMLRETDLEQEASLPGRRALASLLDVGHEVFVSRGYHGTRVDDIVAAAGVSHGAFYRYFQNVDEFARFLGARALRTVSTALAEIPVASEREGTRERAALRRWLRRYNAVHADQGAMIRAWVDAGLEDDVLRNDRAAVFDWGRRRMLRSLRARGFGDVDADAVVMLAVIEAFGAQRRPPVEIDATLRIIEQGLLGRSPAAD